jgi:uncharacterized protein YjiS (DUF1127 family)
MEMAMRMVGKSASAWLHSAHISGMRNKGDVSRLAIGAAVRSIIFSFFRIISCWIDRSNQRNALADLDDHLLRDIGKSSDEALREASKPFWKS